jgi:plastocyanin
LNIKQKKLAAMKKFLLLSFLLASTFGAVFAATHTITNVDYTFSPDSLNIEVGEDVHFNLGSTHNAVEVTKTTWDANQNTPKSGGFSVPLGGGDVTFNTAGIYYYVCSPHAFKGMKGIIVVGSVTAVPTVSNKIPFINVFPDPASDYFTISYTLNSESKVDIRLINSVGAEVGNIVKESQSPGQYRETYTLNNNRAKGNYFVCINADNQSYIKKIIIK